MRGFGNRQPSVVSYAVWFAAREACSGFAVHERRAAHRLDAAGDEEVAVAGRDGVARRDDRREPGRAQPVQRHAGDATPAAPRAATAIRATLRLSSPAWFAQPM